MRWAQIIDGTNVGPVFVCIGVIRCAPPHPPHPTPHCSWSPSIKEYNIIVSIYVILYCGMKHLMQAGITKET